MTSTRTSIRGRSTGAATGQHAAGDAAPGAGEVERAVRMDLDGLAVLDWELSRSGLAASALALARGIDNPRNSLTSKSMAQRALRETMDRLLELAPPPQTNDAIDQLEASAQRKLSGGSTP